MRTRSLLPTLLLTLPLCACTTSPKPITDPEGPPSLSTGSITHNDSRKIEISLHNVDFKGPATINMVFPNVQDPRSYLQQTGVSLSWTFNPDRPTEVPTPTNPVPSR